MKGGVRMGDCEVVGLAGLLDCFFLLGQDLGWMGWDGLGSWVRSVWYGDFFVNKVLV
jgi:hypothetical protein